MKQFIQAHKLLCVILACVIVAGAACAVVLPIALKHEHTFSAEWESDENNHWHKATCEHTEETTGLAKHDFDGGLVTKEPKETEKGVRTYTCSVCNYKKTVEIDELEHTHTFDTTSWEHDGEYHWHKATCEHTEEKGGLEEHDFENIKSDATGHWFECRCGEKAEIEAHTFGNWSEKTAAAVDQNKQYSRKCKDCQYEDVLTFEDTKTNGAYCVAITEAISANGKKIVDVQVLRGTISKGDNIVIDGLDGTFEVVGITESMKNIDSASYGQKVYLELEPEDGDLSQITNTKVGGHLAYAPDTAKTYKTFTAQITIDPDFSGNLYAGREVKLDLYNIGYTMPYKLVLPEGVTVAEKGGVYIVTVTLPDNESRALWAGMEFTYKIYDSASSSDIIVARGIILSVVN